MFGFIATCVRFHGHVCSFSWPRVFVFSANPIFGSNNTFAKLLIILMIESVCFHGHVCSVSLPRVFVFMATCVRFHAHAGSFSWPRVFVFSANSISGSNNTFANLLIILMIKSVRFHGHVCSVSARIQLLVLIILLRTSS